MSPLLLLLTAAYGAPGEDPIEDLTMRLLRAEGAHLILTGSDRTTYAQRAWLEGMSVEDPYYRGVYPAVLREREPEDVFFEGPRPWWDPVIGMRGWTRVAVGDGRTQNLAGDAEPGLFSPRVGAQLNAMTPWLEAHAALEGRVDAPSARMVQFPIQEYWLGLNHGPVRAGFGAEQRVLGPGRHSQLMLGNDAKPFPAGTLQGEGAIWKLGQFRGELTSGWLQQPRRDVTRPGVLLMDLRWAPVPYVEIGATRLSLFGGQDRPLPSIGELLLPLDPHVYDDPDREEPDQDEIASLDARVMVPFGPSAVLDYVEGYLQYGGDDMIVRSIGGLKYPSLAGIANLVGVEVAGGPLTVSFEWARLMDDYFRWYQGHRIYHSGFTQDGRSMGHVNGGDQETFWAQVSVAPGPLGVELWGEAVRRVGVADVLEDQVFVFMSEERRWRAGTRAWWLRDEGGWVAGGYEIGHITGEDFIPGGEGWEHRVFIEWHGAPWVIRE